MSPIGENVIFESYVYPVRYFFGTVKKILLLLQAPTQRAAPSAELPPSDGTGKETKILKEGTRQQGLI